MSQRDPRAGGSSAAPPAQAPPEAVASELGLLETVQANLARLAQGPAVANHEQTLVELRDSLADEKLQDDIASVLEAMDRTAALMAQQRRHDRGTVDPRSPYFGHMVVDDDLGRRSVLIGKRTFLSDRVRIVDWRNAPISRLFYQYGEGDEYDETINGQDISGEVLVRRTVHIAEGELQGVSDDDHAWVRDGDAWVDTRAQQARLAGGAGAALRPTSLGTGATRGRRDKHLREITSLLDRRQFDLITRPDSGPVVIQGSAGSGKTTVGLHRIAYLTFSAPKSFNPRRMMVVAYSKALSAYISQVLPALGVEGVRVQQLDQWLTWLRKMHFRGLPSAINDETPALVTRFKGHLAALRMVDELGRAHRNDPGGGDPVAVFEEAFTDRGWLADGLRRWAPGEFSDEQVTKIHRWCTKQHFIRADGEGFADHERPTLDAEDSAILLRLHQVMRGPLRYERRRPLRYDHIMVDEAQDLSPIELAVLLDAAGARRSVTLAGDAAQTLDEGRAGTDWTAALEALDVAHVTISPLQVSYRATRQIMEVARQILGPLAPAEPLKTVREGAPVAHLRFAGMGEAVTWLAPALTDLMTREPTASVALLTVNQADARAWYGYLDRAEVPGLELVDDQNFSFAPGIEVTDVRSSKGLEFDYVVVLGADAARYPDTPAARHQLHVAATRAAHQLWFVSTGTPTPLLPPGLPGLLGATNQTS